MNKLLLGLLIKERRNTTLKLEAERKAKALEKDIERLKSVLERLPEGFLKIKHNAWGNSRYYHVTKKNNQEGLCEQYISKKLNLSIAKQLAMKSYYKELLAELEKELEVLKNFIDDYDEDGKYKIYERMSDDRKELVAPLYESIHSRVDKFINEPYEIYKDHPENLIHETDRGEFVRSKSEQFIANYLYSNSDKYYYKYECELEVGGEIIHPDFTIINKQSGNIYYLEHLGRLDFPDYTNSQVWKANMFVKEDILPGRNIIYTFETKSQPMNPIVAKKLIGTLII